MTRIHTVLAATDLSAPARHAVARAALLARDAGARLALEHVVSIGALESLRQLFATVPADLQQRLLDGARAEVEQLAAEIAERHGVSADVHLAVGAVLDAIADYADALDADVIVMGALGAGFMSELRVGTTTERVLRKTARPLLVVKQMPHEAYRRVLVPVDFSSRSMGTLRLAHAIAPNAEIVLVHAFEVPFEGKLRYAGIDEHERSGLRIKAKREAAARMNDMIARSGIDEMIVRRVVIHGDPSTRILEQEQEQDCDLIVIGKRGQGIFEELLLGSVTKHVLTQSVGDVLVADRVSA